MQNTIERYLENAKVDRNAATETEQHIQHLKNEAAFLAKRIELLENSQRKLLGHNLNSCTVEELQEIDSKLERSLKNIRTRKSQFFEVEIEKLHSKEKFLLEENARLCGKQCGFRPRFATEKQTEIGSWSQSTLSSEVVTELFIGPPSMRNHVP